MSTEHDIFKVEGKNKLTINETELRESAKKLADFANTSETIIASVRDYANKKNASGGKLEVTEYYVESALEKALKSNNENDRREFLRRIGLESASVASQNSEARKASIEGTASAANNNVTKNPLSQSSQAPAPKTVEASSTEYSRNPLGSQANIDRREQAAGTK